MSYARDIEHLIGPSRVVALRFAIVRGDHHDLGAIREREELTWGGFVKEVSTPQVDRERTHAEFLALPEAKRKALKKRAGWINTGTFKGDRLTNESCLTRSMITLDLDNVSPEMLRRIKRGEIPFAYFAHITRSSAPEAPRLRIYVPTDQPIAKADYRDAARECAKIFEPDLSRVDDCSWIPKTLMYLPQVSRDQDYWHHENRGQRFKPSPRRQRAPEAESKPSKGNRADRYFPSVEALAEAVRAIPNDATWDERGRWFEMLCAIHFESGGSGEGRDIAEEWSEQHDSHDADHFDRTWRSIRDEIDNPITGQFVADHARRHGWAGDFDVIPDNGGTPRKRYEPDEEGVCLAFEDAHKDQLRFDQDAGCWYVLKAGVWRPRGDCYAHYWARERCVDIAKGAKEAQSARLRRASTWSAIEHAERKNPTFAVTEDYWNPDPFLLGTPAGVVNLKTGRLRDARAADRISKPTRVAPIPLDEFDPERHCPQWLDFLDDVCARDDALIRFLQQYAGYALTGDVTEQKLVFIFGPGGNGKGVFQNQLRLVMGGYAVVANMATFAASKYDRHLTELAALAGARLVVASETEEGRAWAETRLKTCTGGDPITARFMRQDEFTFEPEFKLLFIGNHKPNLTTVDDAIKRRVNIVPFGFKPKKVDPDLGHKLRREWPGILAWMIDGCLDWQKRGLVTPQVVKAANADYFRDQDAFQRWLDDRCEEGAQFAANTAELFVSYADYMGLHGETALNKNKSFPDEMRKRGFESVRNSHGIRGRGFRGIRLKAVSNERFP